MTAPRCRICQGGTLPLTLRRIYVEAPIDGRPNYKFWEEGLVCLRCSHDWSPGDPMP